MQWEGLLTERALTILGGVYQVQWSASSKSSLERRGRQFMSVKERAGLHLGDRIWWESRAMACILNEATRSSDLHSTMGPPPQLPILAEKDWTPKHESLHQTLHDNHFNNSIIIILTFRSKPPRGDAKGKVRQSPKSTDLSSGDPIRTGENKKSSSVDYECLQQILCQ